MKGIDSTNTNMATEESGSQITADVILLAARDRS